MKNKQAVFRTLSQIVFIVAAFILSVLVANGFKLTFDGLTAEFAVSVFSKLIFTLLTYNIVFGTDNNNRRQPSNSDYYNTLMTNRLKIEQLYKEKRIPELEKVLEQYNSETYISECNNLIRDCTSRISYDDIQLELGEKGIAEELAKKYKMSDKALKKIMRVVKKILDGKIKYERVEPNDLLIDKDGSRDKKQSMKLNTSSFLLKQNLIKAFSFLLSTVLMTIVTFSSGETNIWAELAKNSTLLLGAVVSAMTLSYNYTKMRRDTFEIRNRFLSSRMDIQVEFRF